MLGLPDLTRACLFDLDGVLTDTASVHAAAWKQMFDEFLKARAERTGEPFRPFDVKSDYGPYVDGKPRLDGTRAFLASRQLAFTEISVEDPATVEELRKLAGQPNVPVLTVDSFVQRGFDADLYARVLESAGYLAAGK